MGRAKGARAPSRKSAGPGPKELAARLEAAQGRRSCDLLIRNCRLLDVFSCRFVEGEIAVQDGVIVGIEPGLTAKRVIDARGAHFVPGFIDAHVHLESSMMVPAYFEQAVLPKGTTSAICDPHELANVQGVKGIEFFLKAAEKLRLDLWVMLSSCVPATHLETNGGGKHGAADLLPLALHPRALGLAEVMNMPGVLNADPEVIRKIVAFQGGLMDGHAPMLKGKALSAYASVGISSCHESSERSEAAEKLLKGISVWVREGSVAKDLKELAPLLNLATSTSMGFCTDDRNPLDIADEGHVDHLVRGAIRSGVAPEVAYRAASWSVARHYGLTNRGARRWGAIAPGYEADLVWLEDPRAVAVKDVLKRGRLVSEMEFGSAKLGSTGNTIKARVPQARDLEGPEGRVHAMEVWPGKILTGRRVTDSGARGVARVSVLERYGKGRKPANAYVTGFGEGFDGAIASSVGHDSHNLIVVGSRTEDMRVALAALIECGGGFAVARGGKVSARLALPFGGLMTGRRPDELARDLRTLKAAGRDAGCALEEPFLQLAFLSLPVIPSLKLTDRGLVDVEAFRLIDVRAS
ncbi:MAG: adenine deaminase [Bdellovibrionales bacterium]|nr:adenine deaminase [Bdellovibrionales bacterium]